MLILLGKGKLYNNSTSQEPAKYRRRWERKYETQPKDFCRTESHIHAARVKPLDFAVPLLTFALFSPVLYRSASTPNWYTPACLWHMRFLYVG